MNAATGQIGIDVYSFTPITSTEAGSLVTIDFHALSTAAAGVTPIDLMETVNPSGNKVFTTALDDSQGALTLHITPTNGTSDPGVDGR